MTDDEDSAPSTTVSSSSAPSSGSAALDGDENAQDSKITRKRDALLAEACDARLERMTGTQPRLSLCPHRRSPCTPSRNGNPRQKGTRSQSSTSQQADQQLRLPEATPLPSSSSSPDTSSLPDASPRPPLQPRHPNVPMPSRSAHDCTMLGLYIDTEIENARLQERVFAAAREQERLQRENEQLKAEQRRVSQSQRIQQAVLLSSRMSDDD